MREKSMKLLVTFHTTAGAMAMEKYCKAQEAPGRLIPVPRSITAACGLNRQTFYYHFTDARPQLEALVAEHQLDAEGFYEELV